MKFFKKTKTREILLLGFGMIIGIVLIFPYIAMLLTALKPYGELFTIPPRWLPEQVKFENLIEVWRAAPLFMYIRNSLFVSGLSTAIAILVGLPAAYGISRLRFPGRRLFIYLVLALRMFAPVILLVGLFRLMIFMNLMNSLWGLVFINAAFNQAFTVWILSGYFDTIPREIEEMAWIDGCSRLGGLLRVIIPAAAPGIVTATIFIFIAAWNEFPVAYTLISSADKTVLPVGLYDFVGQYFVQWQYLFSASLYAIIPVVILFFGIEKYLVGGLTAGALD